MVKAKENCDERRVRRLLECQGYTDIRRPSDDPPDFVVDRRYAVEVRRLNWMTEDNGRTRGIEEYEMPFRRTISKVLEEFGEPPGGYTVTVNCDFPYDAKRLPAKDVVRVKVREAVNDYVKEMSNVLRAGSSPRGFEWKVACGINLFFSPAKISETGRFELIDVEVETASRGWVIADAVQNIDRCVKEKTRKVVRKNRVHDYAEWWLVLVDHILVVPLAEDELNDLRNALPPMGFWSRVVVVSPDNPKMFFELI